MIPPKSDQIWRQIVTDKAVREYTALPTKMLMMRVQMLVRDGRPQKIQEAIDTAYNFFSTNAHVVQQDVKLLFGETKK